MPDAADHDDQVLTAREVADLLQVHASTVRRWIIAGLLPARRLPGRERAYRVTRTDALKLAEQPVKPA